MTEQSQMKYYLKVYSLWEKTDKMYICEKIIEALNEKFPYSADERGFKYRILTAMTGTTYHTIYSWFNTGRREIKVPLIKLMQIALGVDKNILYFLETRKEVKMKKFLLTVVNKKSSEMVLQVCETKEEGYAAGEEYAKTHIPLGNIVSLIETEVNENNEIISNRRNIYNVWTYTKTGEIMEGDFEVALTTPPADREFISIQSMTYVLGNQIKNNGGQIISTTETTIPEGETYCNLVFEVKGLDRAAYDHIVDAMSAHEEIYSISFNGEVALKRS